MDGATGQNSTVGKLIWIFMLDNTSGVMWLGSFISIQSRQTYVLQKHGRMSVNKTHPAGSY